MKLISMTDFILEQSKIWQSKELKHSDLEFITRTIKYANFLKQPLTLGMFVPVDEDGNVLEEPEQYIGALELSIGEDYNNAFEYKQAKSKVLFEGFIIEIETNYITFKTDNGRLWYGIGSKDFHGDFYMKIIEDLIQEIDLPLTETAFKMIYGD